VTEPTPLLRDATARDAVNFEHVRMAEALLFAATEPLDPSALAERLPAGADISGVLAALKQHYAVRGVNLVMSDGRYAFRTANDLAPLLRREAAQVRKLSKAAMETLSIIAYHQPVTRADIEAVRGVAVAKGTLEVLLAAGWVRLRGRRKSPGRPVTFGTTPAFLDHFGLADITDLPNLEELKAAGLLDGRIPDGLEMPSPRDGDELAQDEEALDREASLDFLTPLDSPDEPR
jgi:segregation and condensation protein B